MNKLEEIKLWFNQNPSTGYYLSSTLDEDGNIEERPVIVNHSGESYRPNELFNDVILSLKIIL